MKTRFNPETLEGMSYVLFIRPDTYDAWGVSTWPADGEKTHAWFMQKYPDVTVLKMGVMDYDAATGKWLPYFETNCDRMPDAEEQSKEQAYIIKELQVRYGNDKELINCLGQKHAQKLASYERTLVQKGLTPARNCHVINKARTKDHS